jgi:hypothetical protein
MEEEYERIQTLFFGSKETKFFDATFSKDIAGNKIEPITIPPLNEQLDILKMTTDAKTAMETIICAVCGGKYSHFNKNRHYLTKKHLSARPLDFPECPSQAEASP